MQSLPMLQRFVGREIGGTAQRECNLGRQTSFRQTLVCEFFYRPPPDRPMTLWLDADAAPRDVKDVCLRAAERLRIETILVANQRLQLPLGYTYVSTVRVDGG